MLIPRATAFISFTDSSDVYLHIYKWCDLIVICFQFYTLFVILLWKMKMFYSHALHSHAHTHTHTLSLFLTHCFFPSLSSPPPTYAPHIVITWASQMVQWSTQMVKIYPPAMQEMWVQSLNQEDPLEEGTVTHSSILAWRIPWTEDPSRLQSMGSQRVRTQLKWLSMPVCIIIT